MNLPPISYTDDAGIYWHKATYSGGNNGCLEHGSVGPGLEGVRDTKEPLSSRRIVRVPSAAWSAFVTAAKDGTL